MIAGAVRGIPFYWRLVDCAFGVGGAALLWACRRAILELERLAASAPRGEEVVRPERSMGRAAARGLVALTLATLAAVAPSACTSGGMSVGAGGVGASNVRTGPGTKRIVAKRPPSLLLADDGTGCDVSPDRFRETKEGDLVSCPDWRAEPPR